MAWEDKDNELLDEYYKEEYKENCENCKYSKELNDDLLVCNYHTNKQNTPSRLLVFEEDYCIEWQEWGN